MYEKNGEADWEMVMCISSCITSQSPKFASFQWLENGNMKSCSTLGLLYVSRLYCYMVTCWAV